MESRGELKALFSHGKPRPDANSLRGLPCKNKAFYSPETQLGRRVIKVHLCSVCIFISLIYSVPN